jgi:hypothetical protein
MLPGPQKTTVFVGSKNFGLDALFTEQRFADVVQVRSPRGVENAFVNRIAEVARMLTIASVRTG